MNILIQFAIICAFSYVGEVINISLSLPIPGSIIGLLLLFAALKLKLIKLNQIEAIGTWLKQNLAFFFVPATVGIMAYFDLLNASKTLIFVTMFGSTIITYFVSGAVAKQLQKKEHNHD